MQFFRISWIYLSCCFLLSINLGCNKDNKGDCFNATGKNGEITEELPDFTKINLNGNFDVTITPNSINKITIKGGRNLIPNIDYKVTNEELIVISNNNCGIFRDNSKRITIEIFLDSINKIEQSVSGNLTFSDTLISQELTWDFNQSIGNIHAKIKTRNFKNYIHSGAVDFKISGKSNFALLYCAGISVVKASEFKVDDLELNTLSKGKTYIFPVNKLNLISNNSGDVILYNQPIEIIYDPVTNPEVLKINQDNN